MAIAAVICLVAVVIHTSFFREKAIGLVESMLEKSMRGDVTLGRLEGILLHRATLRGVSIRDRDGRLVLEADLVRVDPDLASLVFHRVLRFENLELVRSRIHLRTDAEGRLNLSELFATETAAPPAEKTSGFTPISIDVHARVVDGFVSYEPHGTNGGAQQQLDDIDLSADVQIQSKRIDLELRELMVTPSVGPSRIAISGRAAVVPERVEAYGLRFSDRFGTSGLVRRLIYGLDSGSMNARVRLVVKSESLRALTGIRDLRGDARITGELSHASVALPWLVDVTGRIGTAPLVLKAKASADFGKLSADLAIQGPLDPSELYATAPKGPLRGTIAMSLEDSNLDRLTGDLRVNLFGRLEPLNQMPVNLERFAVEASAQRGKLSARGRIDSDQANAKFSLQGRLQHEKLVLSPSELELDVRELSAVLPPAQKVSGAVRAKAVVSGGFDSLSGRAEVNAKRLEAGEMKLERLSLVADAELAPKQVRVRFPKLEARLLERDWRTTRAPYVEVVPSGTGWLLELRDFDLQSRSGKIALGGRADLGRKKVHEARVVLSDIDVPALSAALKLEPKVEGMLAADFEVKDDRAIAGTLSLEQRKRKVLSAKVDLVTRGMARIAKADGTIRAKLDAFPLTSVELKEAVSSTVSGTVSGDLTITKVGKKIDADVHATTSELLWDRRWPKMDVALDAGMRGGEISVDGTVNGGPAGRIRLKAAAAAPADPLAPGAWKRLGPNAVKSARLDLLNSDLAALTELFHAEPMSGAISGDLVVREGARKIEGLVSVKRLLISRMDRSFDASAAIDSAGGRTTVHGDLFDRRRPILALEVSLPRDVVQLVKTSSTAMMKLPLEGEVHADRLPVAMLAKFLNGSEEAAGSISADGRLTGSIADPLFSVDLTSKDAAIQTAVFSKLDVHAELDRAKLATKMQMEQKRGGKLDLDAKIELRGKQTIDGRLTANDYDLAFLSLLAPKTKGTLGGVQGTLDADITLAGTQRDPKVQAQLKVDGLRAVMAHPIPPVEQTSVDVSVRQDQVTFSMKGRSGDGRFEITGDGSLPTLATPRVSGKIVVDELSLAAGPRLVKSDLEASWHVRSRANLIEADVLIVDGSARMKSGAEELAPIKSFNDVVLVDRLGEGRGPTPEQDEKKRVDARKIELTVKTKEPILVRSDDLNASISIDLAMETTDEGMVGKGAVNVTDGTITLFGGRRWIIERAEILFPGEADQEPTLGVRLYYDFSDVVVYVDVTGKPSAPEIKFTSDPGTYSQDQLLGFVLGGSPDSAPSEAALGERATGVAAGFLVGQIQNQVKDQLPIDTLSVDVGEGGRASAVLVGKWITDRLFLAYHHRIEASEDENASEGIVRVLFGHGWMLETVYGDRGNGSADVLWIRRF